MPTLPLSSRFVYQLCNVSLGTNPIFPPHSSSFLNHSVVMPTFQVVTPEALLIPPHPAHAVKSTYETSRQPSRLSTCPATILVQPSIVVFPDGFVIACGRSLYTLPSAGLCPQPKCPLKPHEWVAVLGDGIGLWELRFGGS